MVNALETTPEVSPEMTSPQHRATPPGEIPAQRVASPRVPTVGELITEAHKLAKRDGLPFSGHILIERKGSAVHRHSVWLLGPFALVEGGWFGQVHGSEHRGGSARWIRKHERRCKDTHWTQFSWIDESSLVEGCGSDGVGLGLGPDGPVYCAFTAGRSTEHEHVPLALVLRQGLRDLAHLDD